MQKTSQAGVELVERELSRNKITFSRVPGRYPDLHVRPNPKSRTLTVRVFSRAAPSPGGGKGKVSVAWDVPPDCPADHVALVNLAGEDIWIMTFEEYVLIHQRPSPKSYRFVMSFDPSLRSKHAHIQVGDFDQFRLEAWLPEAKTRNHGASSPELPVDETMVGVEGAIRERLTRHRVREQRLRKAKIAVTMANSRDGHLRCEVPRCGFSFMEVYGETGNGYAQVHHRRSLAEVDDPRQTTLDELAIVCANCHAIIHRGGKCRPLETLIPKHRTRKGRGS